MNLHLVGPSCRSAQISGLRSNAALPKVGSWPRFASEFWRCPLVMTMLLRRTRAPYIQLQSQRDYALKPRVAMCRAGAQRRRRHALPWVCPSQDPQPQRGCARSKVGRRVGSQPLQGCDSSIRFPQGSSCLATLGFGLESLWDSGSSGLRQLIRRRSRAPIHFRMARVNGEKTDCGLALPLGASGRAIVDGLGGSR